MEEHVHKTRMPPISWLRKQGHNSRKSGKFEIELVLSFMVCDHVYKLQMICLWGTEVNEQKQVGDVWTWAKL
jgi:hypothetical protein